MLGCELRFAADNPPAVVSHPIESGYDGLHHLRLPEADEGRFPVVLEATRRLRRHHPDVTLYGLVTGPFTLALHLRGTQVFMDTYDCPDDLQRLMAFCAAVAERTAELLVEAGADVIALIDPMTSQIGPDLASALESDRLASAFELRATVCLVDPLTFPKVASVCRRAGSRFGKPTWCC